MGLSHQNRVGQFLLFPSQGLPSYYLMHTCKSQIVSSHLYFNFAAESPTVKCVVSSVASPEVFISYHWGSREVALELKKKLEENGIHCWMDISEAFQGG